VEGPHRNFNELPFSIGHLLEVIDTINHYI
jgi:hypothetical protein